jgi:hypothetical protein
MTAAASCGAMPRMRTPLSILSLGLLCGALAAGCGTSTDGTGSGTFNFSCDITTGSGATAAHTCTELDGLPTIEQPDEESACTGTSGSGCSTAALIGTCAIPPAGNGLAETATKYYYEGGALTASSSQTDCNENGGNWTAGD